MELILIFAMGAVSGWIVRGWCQEVKRKLRRMTRTTVVRTYR